MDRNETNPARILALDVGKRRIGLAVSDELGITAQGLKTLERTNIREDCAALNRIADELGAAGFLIGIPVNMSGTEGRQAEWVRQFATRLAEYKGLPVKFWDERLTSVEAGRVLRASGISIEKRARAVDRLSAVLILQSYLDSVETPLPPGPAGSAGEREPVPEGGEPVS